MPSVFLETMRATIDLVEALPADHGHPAYPMPPLQWVGSRTSRELNVIVLQNDYLVARFAPELGGRLVSLVHRSGGIDVLEGNPELGEGIRGIGYDWGLQFEASGDRRNSMGPVDFQLIDGEESAGVVFFEHEPGSGLSCHIFWSLDDRRARLDFEVRAVNRTLDSCSYDAGLRGTTAFESYGNVLWDGERLVGIAVSGEPGELVAARRGPTLLAPMQCDTFSGGLAPVVGFERVPHLGGDFAFEVQGDRLFVGSLGSHLSGKVVALTGDPTPMEAPLSVPPGEVRTLTLPLGTQDFRLLFQGISEAQVEHEVGADIDPEPFAYALSPLLEETFALKRLGRAIAAKAGVMTCRAIQSIRKQDYERALEETESALLYAGDNPILWWLRAMASRLGGQPDERPELLNAHYLAPQEPLLRAEAFLSLEHTETRDSHPLVAPLADNPDAMVDVACWLYTCRNFSDLFRWVDECLRHREVGRLRLLLAAAYLQSGKDFEASVQVGKIDEPTPPYLWQLAERQALADLLKKWPTHVALLSHAQLACVEPT